MKSQRRQWMMLPRCLLSSAPGSDPKINNQPQRHLLHLPVQTQPAQNLFFGAAPTPLDLHHKCLLVDPAIPRMLYRPTSPVTPPRSSPRKTRISSRQIRRRYHIRPGALDYIPFVGATHNPVVSSVPHRHKKTARQRHSSNSYAIIIVEIPGLLINTGEKSAKPGENRIRKILGPLPGGNLRRKTSDDNDIADISCADSGKNFRTTGRIHRPGIELTTATTPISQTQAVPPPG